MKALDSYLNDHLAGATGALALLDHLRAHYQTEPLGQFFLDLRRDIAADVDVLKQLIGQTRAQQSVFRKIAGWFAGKLVRSKFKIAGQEIGGLGLVQALETLALGIRGKELLWRALANSRLSILQDVDLAMLEQRAIEQQQRVEAKRIEAVRAAFSPSPQSSP